MKFYCESCNTKYTIDDSRVRGRVLKVKCKACGHTIVVRQDGVNTGSENVASDDSVSPYINYSQSQSAFSRTTSSERRVSAVPQEDWYYAVNGKSSGPFKLDDLKRQFASGNLGEEAYVWHAVLGEWQPVANVDVFANALNSGKSLNSSASSAVEPPSEAKNIQSGLALEPRPDKINGLISKLHSSNSQVSISVSSASSKPESHLSNDSDEVTYAGGAKDSNRRKTAFSLSDAAEIDNALKERQEKLSSAAEILNETRRSMASRSSAVKAVEPESVKNSKKEEDSKLFRKTSKTSSEASIKGISKTSSEASIKGISKTPSEASIKGISKTPSETSIGGTSETSPELSIGGTFTTKESTDIKKNLSSFPDIKKKDRSKVVISIIILILLIGGGSLAFYAYTQSNSSQIEPVDLSDNSSQSQSASSALKAADTPVDENTPSLPAPRPEAPAPTPTDSEEESNSNDDNLDEDLFRKARTNDVNFKAPRNENVVVGTLSHDQALDGMKKVSQSVELCRERHVRRGGTFDVHVISVDLTVLGSGAVSELVISPSSLNGTEFVRCMNSQRSRWKFAATNGPSQQLHRKFTF